MKGAIRRVGNSSGVLIPKPLLHEVGAKVGDEVDISVEDGRLVVAFPRAHPRAGWAEAAKLIGAEELSEDDRAWLDLGTETDVDLRW